MGSAGLPDRGRGRPVVGRGVREGYPERLKTAGRCGGPGARAVALDDGGWQRVGDCLVLDITSADEVICRRFTLGVHAAPARDDALALDPQLDEAP